MGKKQPPKIDRQDIIDVDKSPKEEVRTWSPVTFTSSEPIAKARVEADEKGVITKIIIEN